MKSVFLSALFATILLSSCSSDDDPKTEVEIPEEVITDVEVLLTSASGDVTLAYDDEDGIGLGDAGAYIGDTELLANTIYTGAFEISNALAKEEGEEEDHSDDDDGHEHGEDITEEIEELKEEHQFFFEASEGLNLTVTYDDVDDNGYPVGLEYTLETGEASSGTLTIILRHEPNKAGEGVSDGDITNENEGATDFLLEFPIEIVEPVLL